MKALRTAVLFVLAAGFFLSCPARAHDSRPLFIELGEHSDGRIALNWKTPPSVAANNTPQITLTAPCSIIQHMQRQNGLEGAALYACAEGLSDATLSIAYPYYNPSLSTLVRIQFDSGESKSAILDPAQSTWVIPAQTSFSGVAASYLMIGVRHILSGLDHLLFLAGLLYIARTPRRVIVTVTGFTLAHSMTIFLTAFDIVRFSVPAVEAVIALSIVFLASEIARNNCASLAWRRPVLVAGGFGLVHGAGFAAALAEIGLPQTEKVGALLFFNLGVEAGQFGVIALIFGAAYAASHLKVLHLPKLDDIRLRNAYAYGLGTIAALWFFQRVASALA